MTELTVADLKNALAAICQGFSDNVDQLNELDSQLGDGDLGTTLGAISTALQPKIDTLPADIGDIFSEIANTIAATSGSSFSAITMFGLLKVASLTRGRTSISISDVPELIDFAVAEMSNRGGAQIGDKTLLDGLAHISASLRSHDDSISRVSRAKDAAKAALDSFRDQPSGIGRARIAGERSIGLIDPGMYALYLATDAL